MTKPWEIRRFEGRTIALTVVLAVAFAIVATTDLIAAAAMLSGIVVVGFAARRRRRSALVGALAVALALITGLGTLTAIAVDASHNTPAPLLVRSNTLAPFQRLFSGGASSATVGQTVLHPVPGRLVTLGYVDGTADDTASALDRDLPGMSVVAPTGIHLSDDNGNITSESTGDIRARTQMNGSAGFLMVSNEQDGDFLGDRAAKVIADPTFRSKLVSGIANELQTGKWDGVNIDLEQLPPSARADLVTFMTELKQQISPLSLTISVPVFTDPADPDAAAYDLAGLGRVSDAVAVMAYDEHDPTGEPGPIASQGFVQAAMQQVATQIPASKLLLGVGGYGYRWPAVAGTDSTLNWSQWLALKSTPGAAVVFDTAAGEWHLTLPDGTQAWYSDSASIRQRSDLALKAGWLGVALWRIGSEDPATMSVLPTSPNRGTQQEIGRPVEHVNSQGVVALTFDDGPDPQWTPQILQILRDKGVPGTFFVIGKQAKEHPELLNEAMAEGSVIGNHTYSHPNLAQTSPADRRLEILGGAAVIEGITGHKPRLFRFPYGEGDNSDRNARRGDKLTSDLGFVPVRWDNDPQDWARPGVDEIVQRAVSQADERSIILLHDGGGDRSQTVAALPKLIDALRAKGYTFTTADALDAGIPGPYIDRHSIADRFRGVLLVSGFRLWDSTTQVLTWTLVLIVILSLFRLLVGLPLAFGQRRAEKKRRLAPAGALPRISAIVPAHNEEAVIDKTIRSLLSAEWDDLEIIVVDDGSHDRTAELAGAYAADGVRLIRQAQSGKATALNTGIAAAEGDVVVVIDADTMLDPGFFREVAPHFADPEVVAVAGNVKVGNRRTLLGLTQALEYVVALNLDRRAQDSLNCISVVPGAAGAFRRETVLAAGGYPTETLVEDADLTVALLAGGGRILYESRAIAWTEAPGTVRDVLKQRRRWSFGTVQVVARRSDLALRRGGGRLGWLGLPWMLLTQIVLPVVGVLVDLFLIGMFLSGNIGPALTLLVVSLVTDFALVVVAIALDRERWTLLLGAPLLRLVWRPIQMVAVIRSVYQWLVGQRTGWRKVTRYGTAVAHGSTGPNVFAAARSNA